MATSKVGQRLLKGLENFGYSEYLSVAQQKTIEIIFKGKKDVFLNMVPGEGKSLCFQLPTVMKPNKIAVIFVPTDTLAQHQILLLKRNNMNCTYFCTQTCKKEIETLKRYAEAQTLDDIETQFLYVLVEKKTINLFKDYLILLNNANKIAYVVFDEAHCISLLSHEYIPLYRDVAQLIKDVCPNICKIALTGTANVTVMRDSRFELDMGKSIEQYNTVYRRTVYYDVFFKDCIPKPFEHLKEFIEKVLNPLNPGPPQEHEISGLIFCRDKHAVITVAENLLSLGIPAVAYHGNLRLNERHAILKQWTDGDIQFMITTHKFGIGLHKPNVRFVVHWNLPWSIQEMWQNDGRITRSTKRAYCRVYHSNDNEEATMRDIKSHYKMTGHTDDAVEQELKFFHELIDYCFSTTCRHVIRWKKFNQIVLPCLLNCDACRFNADLSKRIGESLQHRTSINITSEPTEPCRKHLFLKLLDELMANYKKNRGESDEILTEIDITNVARRLENSLLTQFRWKYYHDVKQAILSIRKSTDSDSVCGYLKYFVDQEKRTLKRKQDFSEHLTKVNASD